jgi:very-short-patch-repair endonuclease
VVRWHICLVTLDDVPRRSDPEQRCSRHTATTLRNPDQAVAAVATRQVGMVSTAQLRQAGVSSSGIRRRVEAGHLHPWHRGVYAVGHPALPFGAHLWAATLACGPQTTISSWSTAAWLELSAPRVPIHVTVPAGRGRHRPGLVIHGGKLAPQDVVVRDGLRMTSWARTMLDIAADASLDEVIGLLDRSAAKRLATTPALLDVLARGSGHNGTRRLRQALLIVHPQGVLTRSELERRALRMVRAHRLPIPEVNARLGGYEVDFLWRERRLVVETDGGAWHSTSAQRERDTRKAANLIAAGWTVLRLTWRQVVHEPHWAASRIEGALRRVVAA